MRRIERTSQFKRDCQREAKQPVAKVFTAFDRIRIPAHAFASRSHMVEYAPSSRLVRRAQPRPRCSQGFHLGGYDVFIVLAGGYLVLENAPRSQKRWDWEERSTWTKCQLRRLGVIR